MGYRLGVRMGLVFAVLPGALAAQGDDTRPAWSPQGDRILFQSTRHGNSELYALSLVTGETRRITVDLGNDVQASWAPDGERIVFASDRDRDSYSGRSRYQLYVADSDGGNIRRLIESEAADFMPRWSPDGRWIAFLSDRSGHLGLYVVSVDGGEPRALLPASWDASAGNPSWSPDSQRVAFDADRGSGYEIYTVGLHGDRVTNVTASQDDEWYPAWSPDGSQILSGVLTGTREDGTHQLVAFEVDGPMRWGLTVATPRDEHARDWWPSWSPDGTQVVFVSRRDGPWRLYLIDADGTGERALTTR